MKLEQGQLVAILMQITNPATGALVGDRRRHARCTCDSPDAIVVLDDGGESTVLPVILKDWSVSGLCVVAAAPLKPLTKFSIVCEVKERAPVTMVCTVARCAFREDGRFSIGATFERVHAAQPVAQPNEPKPLRRAS